MKKNNFWGFFQSLGKTFMLPVSLLAACGILLGVGSGFTNPALYKTVPFLGYPAVKLFFQFMTTVGLFAFVNLPVMFAIAIPLGLAEKNKGVAAFSGYVGFSMTALAGNFFLKATGTLATPENMKAAGQAMVLGIQSVDVGVLGGVVIGIIVYKIHERFCESVLPDAFAFFGGARFVPIMTTLFFGFFGLIVPIVWPFFNGLIMQIGNLIGKAGVFGPFIFGAGEALLRPFGLHHILVAMIRFTSAGGTEVINGEAVHGALNIFYQYFADGVLNADATRFLSQGKMPTYIFGLPGVALAMYQTARPENKKKIKGLLISGVVACVVGGITEPLEFIFLFLAPVLYLFHVVMVGLGFMVMALLHVAIGNTDGNIIDFLVFGLLQGNQTKWYFVLVVGIVWFFVYYGVFKYAILKFNLKTPGREVLAENEEAKLGGFDEERLLKALGGKSNILSLDNCVTRLRLTLNDASIIDEAEIKATGAVGVVKLDDTAIQVIIGPQVHVVKNKLDKLMRSTD